MSSRRIATVAALATTALVASLMIVSGSGAAPTRLTAPLRGSDSTDTDGRGRAVVRIDPQARTACFNLRWNNLDDQPFAAHIHEGEAGVDGGIVVHFFNAAAPDQPVPPGISGVSGCATNQNRAVLRDILGGPRGFYVNIHTASFPGGAIRGQLRRP